MHRRMVQPGGQCVLQFTGRFLIVFQALQLDHAADVQQNARLIYFLAPAGTLSLQDGLQPACPGIGCGFVGLALLEEQAGKQFQGAALRLRDGVYFWRFLGRGLRPGLARGNLYRAGIAAGTHWLGEFAAFLEHTEGLTRLQISRR